MRSYSPNKAVERTGNKLALVPRRSPLALGPLGNRCYNPLWSTIAPHIGARKNFQEGIR